MAAHRSILALTVLFPLLLVYPSAAQSVPAGTPLSVEEVVKLSQNGVSEDVIVTKIKKNGRPFNLNADELLELQKAGVKDTVVKYLLDPSQPYAPPAPPPLPPPAAAPSAPVAPPAKPDPPSKKYPEDAYASRVPPETGLYRFHQNAPLKTDIKMLLGENQGPGLGKVLMKKGKVTAYLVGPLAKSRIADSAPVFYLRLPEGKSIEELLLLTFERKKDRREVDMGAPGPKPELKPETMKQFDALEVGPSVFRLSTSKLGNAEYMFYLIGSAEPPKGNYGKGYDFGIDAPAPEKKKR
jgi:hypothetical protein